ncbi:MAG TPA: alpha/beta fold hydrolase, partial [Pirellulales bacterium]|nr:alpha/beta fold hydrolase [Pirellulales bacterium]
GPEGAYLIDMVWFAAFYGQSPESKVPPIHTELTKEQATALQHLAWDVVKNYPDCGLYEEGSTPVGKPELSPSPTKLGAITRITLSSSTPGAWFRYTLDGTTPTRTRGYVYCGTISVQPGMTVKAAAYKSGMADSAVVEATYPEIQKVSALPELPETVTLQRDVQFGQVGDDPLLLDVLRPKAESAKPRPAVLFIHGGGWQAGDKSSVLARLLPLAASDNYVCVAANYRLSFQAPWPAQLHDCKAAVRWLRANAKDLNIDPKRIGVIGGSAGGHLVSMLALTVDMPEFEGTSGSPGRSSRVACCVDVCGPSNLVTFAKAVRRRSGEPIEPMISQLMGGPVDEHLKLARAASPMNHVASGAPPILILHGTRDGTVPIAQSEDFYKALKQADVDATFIKVVGSDHAIQHPEAYERVYQFFDKHLLGRDIAVSADDVQASPKR